MDEDKVFDSNAIRNTATHNSDKSQSGEFTAKTIIIGNSLNQSATVQLQGSRDGATWINIGTVWVTTSGSNSYQTVSSYFPFYRLQASCGTSPTSGVLDAWIIKVR